MCILQLCSKYIFFYTYFEDIKGKDVNALNVQCFVAWCSVFALGQFLALCI